MGWPILMKLAPEVRLIKIFQKPSWFCSLTFSSKVKWGGGGVVILEGHISLLPY